MGGGFEIVENIRDCYIKCFVVASFKVFFADPSVGKEDLWEAVLTLLLFGFLLPFTCTCG